MIRSALCLAGAAALFQPLAVHAAAGPVDNRVRLNSIGFTPNAPKEATVAASATRFRVLRISDDAVVLEGNLGAARRTAAGDTDESVQVAQFSELVTEGEYQLDIPGVGRSAPFRVKDTVWNEPLKLVTRGLYLWRCGTDVHATWKGVPYNHAACHLDDAWLDYVGGGHVRKDGKGGWHDAGDYNKYVVNAGVSVGLLFKAWEQFRDRIGTLALDIPESTNGTPDFLDEIRWELEWLLKMQMSDGRVYHKVSALNFNYWGVPELDTSLRYFVPWGTTATADFAAMMAMAARHYREFDAAFADRCLAAARLAWQALLANPNHVAADQTGFSTGGYEANDAVHRIWAAAELWATTRETEYLQFFEQRAADRSFSNLGPTWGDTLDLGLATYLETNSSQRNAALVERLRASVVSQADSVIRTMDEHAYGRGMGGGNWWWGANGSVAAQTFLLHVADRMQPNPKYRRAAEKTLGFLFGRNYHNRSYVTGLGHEPPAHPHDRRGEPAWPGYLVGGGHPTGKSWKDVQSDYEQNEIALNWNASLIYAVAALAETPRPTQRYDWASFPKGTPTTFQPVFTEPGPLTFSATGLPSWATLNPSTGAISGVPADDQHRSVTVDALKNGSIVASRIVNLMVANPGNDAQVLNLSSRGMVGRGAQQMIAGFAVSEAKSRTLLIRAVGPGLAQFGVSGTLADPKLNLDRLGSVVATNDNWGQLPNTGDITATMAAVGAFALPANSKDAVLLANVGGGTALASGADNGTGVAIVELYDVNPDDRSSSLQNISTRAMIGTGDNVLISGVALRGGGTARLLIRAIGPALSNFGVEGAISDPKLTVFSGQTVLAVNDNWGSAGDSTELAEAFRTAGGFALPSGSADAALIVRLPAGPFTIKVEGASGQTGIGLVEIYLMR